MSNDRARTRRPWHLHRATAAGGPWHCPLQLLDTGFGATILLSGNTFTGIVLRSCMREGGTVDEDILDRDVWHWEFREFTGIAPALEAGDEDEALDGARKLREGLLRGHFEE